MADLFYDAPPKKVYWDRHHFTSLDEQIEKLRGSCTVYVGNISFYTADWQIAELFACCGPVKKVRMGLNRFTKKPCGFCFVEFFAPEAALRCISLMSGTTVDGQKVRCELDPGWVPGREFGRGNAGGQVRDDIAGAQAAAPSEGGPDRKRQRLKAPPSAAAGAGTAAAASDAAPGPGLGGRPAAAAAAAAAAGAPTDAAAREREEERLEEDERRRKRFRQEDDDEDGG